MHATPAVPSLIRELNERSVLDTLRANGALHAAEIARHIGLSKPTTADILRSLIETGLIQEYTPGEDDPKRARSVYEAVSDLKVSLAIDIGSRFIRAAVGDLNEKMLAETSVAVKSLVLKDLIAVMHTAVDSVLKESGYSLKDVASLVVGTPGVVDQNTGVVAIAGTIAALDGVNLADLLKKEFGIAPIVENDINLVTVAEQAAGHGRGIENFAVLSVGSGLGSGLVLNGKIHRGHRGAAGEIFYVPFGDPLDTHRDATNPSGDRIAELTRGLAKKFKDSVLQEPYSTVEILKAAKEGDELAKAVINLEAERIALYVAAISAVTDVELIVLSGGIGRQASFFLDPIKKLVGAIVPFPPRIEVSTLGDTGILVGALNIATAKSCDAVFQDKHKSSHPLAGSM
ncbi:NagC Transcriptional regulator/sugar kinase [Candidatus Nanopelagicaceae bacterium]